MEIVTKLPIPLQKLIYQFVVAAIDQDRRASIVAALQDKRMTNHYRFVLEELAQIYEFDNYTPTRINLFVDPEHTGDYIRPSYILERHQIDIELEENFQRHKRMWDKYSTGTFISRKARSKIMKKNQRKLKYDLQFDINEQLGEYAIS